MNEHKIEITVISYIIIMLLYKYIYTRKLNQKKTISNRWLKKARANLLYLPGGIITRLAKAADAVCSHLVDGLGSPHSGKHDENCPCTLTEL